MIDTQNPTLWNAIDHFYRLESRLLQEHRYRDWLVLMDPAIEYRVPVTTFTNEGLVARDNELGYYDENLDLLTARVAKLESKLSWVEQPPSRLRYFVQVNDIQPHGETLIEVISNVLLFQYRWNMDQQFTGCRTDLLRQSEGQFRIVKRTVVLDRQSASNQGLSVFF